MAIYDTEAESYDLWYDTKVGQFIDEIQTRLVFSMLEPNKGMRVLDIGCGTGNQSIKLANAGCDVTGVDVSTQMLEKAIEKRKCLPVKFFEMDAANLDFPDNSFDAVISVTAFEFIPDISKVFKEMIRVLKPDAPIVVGTLNLTSNWGKLYTSKKMLENSIFRYASLKSKDDLKALYPQGLQRIEECLFIPPNAQPEEFTYDNEINFSGKNAGGFICAKWIK